MKHYELIHEYASRLRLPHLDKELDSLINRAQENKYPYAEFLAAALEVDAHEKQGRDYGRRMAAAHLPARHSLELYDTDAVSGITEKQLKELRDLAWMRQAYNLIIQGGSGTGKTFLAAGLVADVIQQGGRGYLVTLTELMNCLRLKDSVEKAGRMYRRLLTADILAIDDIMLCGLTKEDTMLLFSLVNELTGKTSIIITSQRLLTDWAKRLEDEVLAAAILDRLLERSEVIQLIGNSYRLENRQTFFQEP